MDEIHAEYGYYLNVLDSFTLKDKDGLEKIISMMELFRIDSSPFRNTKSVIDYSASVEVGPGFGKLPSSNVFKYILNDGSRIAVRPSGTERKIKIYYSVKDSDHGVAEKKFTDIRDKVKVKLGLD